MAGGWSLTVVGCGGGEGGIGLLLVVVVVVVEEDGVVLRLPILGKFV